MAPAKPVKCTYVDRSLTADLGESFEGMVEITGKLRYKPEHPWPFAADVEHITKLPRKPKVSLKDLVGLMVPKLLTICIVSSLIRLQADSRITQSYNT